MLNILMLLLLLIFWLNIKIQGVKTKNIIPYNFNSYQSVLEEKDSS